MQLPLFQEHHEPDTDALARCRRAEVVAVDIETETRWNGVGPKADFGLSYPAAVTVIALAWGEPDSIETTALAAPFGDRVLAFLNALIASDTLLIAHNAVFDFRQISKLTGGRVPRRVWDTQSMARLIHPAVDASYSLICSRRRAAPAHPRSAAGAQEPARQAPHAPARDAARLRPSRCAAGAANLPAPARPARRT